MNDYEQVVKFYEDEGYIVDLPLYKKYKDSFDENAELKFPESSFNWISDFLPTLQEYVYYGEENYLSEPLIKNKEVVVLDQLTALTSIKVLVSFLDANTYYIIQQQSGLDINMIPNNYKIVKSGSDSDFILSNLVEEAPYVYFSTTGKFHLTILKKCQEKLTSIQHANYLQLSEKINQVVSTINFNNFNSKMQKLPIILYQASNKWQVGQFSSVLGASSTQELQNDGILKNLIIFGQYSKELQTIVNEQSFMLTFLNVQPDEDSLTEFKLVEKNNDDKSFYYYIYIKNANYLKEIVPQSHDIEQIFSKNQQLPVNSNLHFVTLFERQYDERGKQMVKEMYDYINLLANLTQDEVNLIIKEEKVDEKILSKIITKVPKLKEDTQRIERNLKQFRKFFERSCIHGQNFTNLVDLGCADGLIAESVGKYLNIKEQNIIGLDIRDIRKSKIQFIQTDLEAKINIPNNCIQLALIQQVLHHIMNWRNVISEIYNKLENYGYFIIRESLVGNSLDSLVLDVQHALYATLNREMSPSQYVNEFFTKYITQQEIVQSLESVGFKIRYMQKDYVNDKFNKYWIICQKLVRPKIVLKE